MLSASVRALPRISSRSRSPSARLWDRMASASSRACWMILADSVFSLSSSPLACCASSSDLRIAFWRVSSASSSGPQASFFSAQSSPRNVRIVQMNSPGSGWTSGFISAAHDQHEEREHFRENRHAFEEEQRQIDRAGDLGGGAGLPGDALGGRRGELADAERRADHNHAEPDGNRRELHKTCHQLPPSNDE